MAGDWRSRGGDDQTIRCVGWGDAEVWRKWHGWGVYLLVVGDFLVSLWVLMSTIWAFDFGKGSIGEAVSNGTANSH